MKYYEVTGLFVTFGIGMVLKLDENQSRARAHALSDKDKGKDIFTVTSPVHFKHGEIIGIAKGQLSRALENQLTLLEDKKEKHNGV